MLARYQGRILPPRGLTKLGCLIERISLVPRVASQELHSCQVDYWGARQAAFP